MSEVDEIVVITGSSGESHPLSRKRLPTSAGTFAVVIGVAIVSLAAAFYAIRTDGSAVVLISAVVGSVTFTTAVIYFVLERRTRAQIKKIEVERVKSLEEVAGSFEKTQLTIDNIRSVEQTIGQLDFERNLKRPLILRDVETNGFDVFGPYTWEFRPQINVLLGRNGYGKTRLLQTLCALLARDSEICRSILSNSPAQAEIRLALEHRDQQDDDRAEPLIHRNRDSFVQTIGQVPVLAIPDSRFINKSRTDIVPSDGKSLTEQGSYHLLHQLPYEAVIQTFLFELCIDYLNKRTFDQPSFRLVEKVIGELTGREFRFSSITSIGQARFRMEVITEGNENTPIPIQQASQGTLSLVATFGVIYSYLRALYGELSGDDLLAKPAIVIIDEIDAHLHPLWQRRVVSLLRTTFPRIQFLLTAHSPLVVSGCLDLEVAVLRRGSAAGQFTVYQFVEDFIGWDADRLYRRVFDVEGGDDSYNLYSALYPQREVIAKRVAALAQQRGRSDAEENELRELRDKLYYIDKTAVAQRQRNESIATLVFDRSADPGTRGGT